MVSLRFSALLLVACFCSSRAFVVPSPWTSRQNSYSCLFSSNDDIQEGSESLSFNDAEQALREEEEEMRMASRGNENAEDKRKFDANKGSYDDMRAKIRARATEMGVEKSVATAEAIKAATARSQAGENASEQMVDLTKFGSDLLDSSEEDELTEEQKLEIDPISKESIFEQAMNEIKNTKFPTAGATLKQAGLMVAIFLVTAGIILKVDEALRIQITDWGFIPKPNDIGDYSDLALPEGFTEMMNDVDLEKMN